MGCAASRPQPSEGGTALGGAGSAKSIIATKQAVKPIIATEQAVTLGAFANAAALEEALRKHKVDIAAWDRDGAKGVAQLFTELENGESVLNVESGRVTRCLRVVKVRALPIICPSYLPCRSRATLLSTQSWLAPPCRPRMLA